MMRIHNTFQFSVLTLSAVVIVGSGTARGQDAFVTREVTTGIAGGQSVELSPDPLWDGLKLRPLDHGRLRIDEISPQAASDFGLRVGDEIVTLNGQSFRRPLKLNHYWMNLPAGDAVFLIQRDGVLRQQQVVVPTRQTASQSWLGAYVADDPGRPNVGAIVERVVPASPAASGGLHRGDVVIQADQMPIVNAANLQRVVNERHPNDRVVFRVNRDGAEVEVPIVLGTRSHVRPWLVTERLDCRSGYWRDELDTDELRGWNLSSLANGESSAVLVGQQRLEGQVAELRNEVKLLRQELQTRRTDR